MNTLARFVIPAARSTVSSFHLSEYIYFLILRTYFEGYKNPIKFTNHIFLTCFSLLPAVMLCIRDRYVL